MSSKGTIKKSQLTPIHIDITQSILDKSIRGSPFSCPLSLALQEMGFKRIVVLPKMGISCDRFKSTLPEVITEYLIDFDQGAPMTPIAFDLKVKLWNRVEDPKRQRRSSGELIDRMENPPDTKNNEIEGT